MKKHQLFTKQVNQWRQQASHQPPQFLSAGKLRDSWERLQRRGRTLLLDANRPTAHYRGQQPPSPNQNFPKKSTPHSRQSSTWATAAVTVVVLTAAIGQRFYNEPKLAIGTTAPQTFVAPDSATVTDEAATAEKRRAAETGSLKILMIDQATNQAILDQLQRLLNEGTQLRQDAGTLPFISTAILSTETQEYLRQLEEWDWRRLRAAALRQANQEESVVADTDSESIESSLSSAASQQALRELSSYYRRASTDDIQTVDTAIAQARQQYADVMERLKKIDPEIPASAYSSTLLNLSTSEWQSVRTAVRETAQRMLAQGIAYGTPDPILKRAVELQVKATIPDQAQFFASELILATLKPNLIEDPEQTRMAAQRAAQAVDPVQYTVQEGSTIVTAGAEIDQETFVVLDYFGLSRRGVNWVGFVGFGIAIAGSVTLFLWVERTFYSGLRRRDHVLILLLTLSTPVLAVANSSLVILPAVGLLTGSFYGSILSVTVVGLLAVLLPIGLELSMVPFIAAAAGGIVGGIMAGRLRSREELALLGGAVGLTQAVVYLLLTLIFTGGSSPIWYLLIANSAWHGFIGLAWSVVALGISPYLEHVFDLVTAIRLAELSNPNRPLLKRLASEAPGTFQHTMFVASLAEAAARALNCNVELVRAGTLYHDIGKMHDPLGFIENQMGGPNKHDEINDPWRSAAIIKKHVTEGIVMAKKCRLPKAVRAFIPEHQGAMLITYFYHQAQQQAEADPTIIVNEQDFRYDGPIPQTRETGIVMLADSCEAALRSLKDASPEEALAMVNRILRARWKDDQLIDSGLNRDDMTTIANIFVKVWQQYNHQRIPYPKSALKS